METHFQFTSPLGPCGYLPEQEWSLEYEYASVLSPEEYLALMQDNWRRFGHLLFRPRCPSCRACRALRVRVHDFRPNRSQRRVMQANEGVVELRIGTPEVTREKLALYDRYHAHQAGAKGWPLHEPRDPESFARSFVEHPFAVEEWCFYLEERLIGVGYVDALSVEPIELAGLSAIYFFYDPDFRERSLGTWNVLRQIAEARRRGLPYVYLGFYVEGCASMQYKANFLPNEVREVDGVWRPYRNLA